MQFPRTEITHQAIKYIEEGVVDYVVLDSHDDVSKAGNPILVLKMTLQDGQGTTCLCSDHIPYMESMRWKIKHSMLSAALDYADKRIDPAIAMKGRKGKCKVKYCGLYLQIRDYITGEEELK